MSKHANVGLLKTPQTHGSILIKLMKPLLIEFQLMDKVITYVIDKGCDLNTIRTKLSSIGTCAPLKLEQPFVGFFFSHAMSKACQYATNDTKFYVG